MRQLTKKQAIFVQEYLIDFNATGAAIRSGYNTKTAGQTGYELLKKPEIHRAIQSAIQQRSQRTQITQDQVLREYARIAFSDLRQVLKWNSDELRLLSSERLSDDAAAAISEITQTITKDGGRLHVKLHDKLNALDRIARHLGMLDGQSNSDDPYANARKVRRALKEMSERTRSAKREINQ